MAEAIPNPEIPKPPKLEQAEVNRLAFRIGDIWRVRSLQMYIEVGAEVLKSAYLGRFDVWHAYNQGDQSITALVQKLHEIDYTTLSRFTIARCVNIYEQDVVLGGLAKWKNLTPTHFFVIQPLSLADQAVLVPEADEKALRVADLVAMVRKMKQKGDAKTKPAPTKAEEVYEIVEKLRRTLVAHDTWLAELHEAGLEDSFANAFDERFNQFTLDVEDLIVVLSDMGAKVPADQRDQFLRDRLKRNADAIEAAKRRAGAGAQ